MKLFERTNDYTKEHKILDNDGGRIFCPHCGKTLEERDNMPDYGVFMGPVWIKQNLPCKPYDDEPVATPQPKEPRA